MGKSISHQFHPRRAFYAGHDYLLPHVLRLHFAYHCCFANLYLVCSFTKTVNENSHVVGDLGPLNRKIDDCIFASLESARSAIELIKQASTFGEFFPW